MLDATWPTHSILKDHYKTDPCKGASENKNLSEEDNMMLHVIVSEFKLIFEGKLGT